MSQEPSSKPPRSSPAEAFERGAATAAEKIDAADRIAAFGIYGVVWLNATLTVEKTFGTLVDFVTPGACITEAIMAFYGLENEILALRAKPDRVLELPAVGVPDPEGHSHRMNFSFFWNTDTNKPLLLAYRANSQTEIELELSRQIRARLIAESEVSAKSRELARANADLESFAAIVSHDLKAPLRHMRQMADTLITHPAIAEDETASARLRQLQNLSRRMSHMLTELFDYASLGRKHEAIAEIDTSELITGIVAAPATSGIGIRIDGDWPTIATLAAPLDLILRNLIQNALQHHDRNTGRIVVSCANETSELIIEISDDGPGIPPEHHGAIFLPFRTLGSPDGKGGTGIGLAMVKKMVDAAGGTITVRSDPRQSRGATFVVKWPKLIRTRA